MMFREDRIAVFVDGANLHAAAQTLGFAVNYKKLLNYFHQQGDLRGAYYYTGIREFHEGDKPIQKLVDYLAYNGWRLVTKPTTEYRDEHGRPKTKGNLDIELALDAFLMADKVDHIYLVTGDGDHCRLVEEIQKKGVIVTVMSTKVISPPEFSYPMVSNELRKKADAFVDINDISDQICRLATDREI